MKQLPAKIKRRIDRFLPVEIDGLTLWPVTVDYWEEFRKCVPALEFMRQSLPVALLQIPLLTALFQIEIANAAFTDGSGNAYRPFSCTLYALWLALRLGPDVEFGEVLADRAKIVPDPKDPNGIESIIFVKKDQTGKDEYVQIFPRQYERIRPILAAQNGVRLYDENENPELVYADKLLRAEKSPKLEEDFAKRVAWCAALCHAEETEIYGWPILKFENRCEVLKRTLDYVIFGTGAASGLVKYEGGPPVPSPYFARSETAADRLLTNGSAAADKAVRSGLEKAKSEHENL